MDSVGKRTLSGGLRKNGMAKRSLPGRPLISVVTVVYNRARDLETTLASVLGQTYREHVEYILVDGGSTDGTLDIIRQHDDRIDYWISEPDKGIYDAMNKAADLATGEWINFMNCGDRFASATVLEEIFADKPYTAHILYGDTLVEYQDSKALFKTYPIETIWKNSPFCHQACFARVPLMREYKFDLNYKVGADHDFFYRAYMAGRQFLFVNKLICYFDGTDGTTKKWIVKAIKDKMTLALKYEPSFGKWLYYQCYLIYLYLLLLVKKLAGPKLTMWLTRVVKRRAASA